MNDRSKKNKQIPQNNTNTNEEEGNLWEKIQNEFKLDSVET